MEKALTVPKTNYWTTKPGKILLMVLSPIAAIILMCMCSVIWIAALFVVFIVVVCVAPFLVWLITENKRLEVETKIVGREAK